MDKNEIKESRNEVSRIVKKPVENIYGLASLYRVFFARVIDIVIWAIPVLIVSVAWRNDADNIHGIIIHTVVNFVVEFVSIFIFLVFIPSFTKGTTIGKGLCGIRLRRSKGDKKVKWYMLLAREAYFLYVPLVIVIAIECIALGILLSDQSKPSEAAYVISQLAYIFYFLWFVFLLVTIKAQSEHQSGIDMHFGLFVVYKEPIKQITEEVEVKERSVILTDEPGNLSKDNLDELRNDEQRKFSKSISLEDLDLEINKDELLESKKKKDEPKKIEGSKKNDKKKGDKK